MPEQFFFLGVTTGASSIVGMFPVWTPMLGIDAELVGRDLPLDASPADYRAVVEEIVRTPTARGALVTTHKIGIFRHAGDMFTELDDHARVCAEVSCIAKRDGRLHGYAKDPITGSRTLDEMFGRESPAEVLCLGAGGAGVALTLCLSPSASRVVLTDVDPARLEAARQAHRNGTVEYHLGPADSLVEALPPGSLVINATGMGKDRPGSPLDDATVFPERGIAWDLNYRGDLTFLAQAKAQEERRQLGVHDGWRYFLHGWAEHLAEVFDLDMPPERFAALAAASEPFRPTGTARVSGS